MKYSFNTTLPRSLQQSLLYGLGIFIMKGVSFFMLPFIAHRLTTVDFGRLEILTSLASLGTIIVGFGLLEALFRFMAETDQLREKKQLAAETFGLALLIGFVTLLLGLFLATPLSTQLPGALNPYDTHLVLLILALESCLAIPLGWLRLQDKAGQFFLINTSKALLQAGLVIFFLNLGRGISGILEAGLLAALVQASVLFTLQWRQTGITLCLPHQTHLLTYGWPLVTASLVAFVLSGLDRWLLAAAIGPAAMAQYAVAAKFALAASLLLQPFGLWWFPRRFQVLKEKNGPQQAAYYAAMGSALALLTAVGVGLCAPLLIGCLLPPEYQAATLLVPWLVFSRAIKDSADLMNLGCFSGKKTHGQLLINMAASGVGLVMMLTLLPRMGNWGMVVALYLAETIRLFLFFMVSQRLLPLPYPTAALLRLASFGLTSLLINSQIDALSGQLLFSSSSFLTLLIISMREQLIPGWSQLCQLGQGCQQSLYRFHFLQRYRS